MSIRLRVRYQYKYFLEFLYSFRMPGFLTGMGARISLAFIIVLLSVGYLYQLGDLTTGGYKLAELENKIAVLDDEAKKINTELAAHQSLNSLQKRLKGNMVPVSNIKYIKVTDTAMAQR